MRATIKARSDRGDTLLEVLLALLVVGLGAVAILLAFTTTIIGSTEYRTLATVDTVLRSAAESATSQIQQQPASAWESCSDASSSAIVFTASTGYALPAGYTVQAPLSVQYWNPTTSAFQATCVPNSAQLVQLTVVHNGISYSITFVVNDPLAAAISPPGAATHLAFVGQPGSTISGSPISPPPVVAVEDANNNIVTTDLSPVQITITPGSGSSGATLSSNCAGVEFYGVVTFSNCSISLTGSNYTLTATNGTLPASSPSAPFNILPAPASQLVFSKVPSGGQPVSPTATSGAYQIQEQDIYGNPVAALAPVTLTLATSSSGTTGFTPFFSSSSGGASATATTTVTIPMGATTSPSFYYSDTQAGTPTLTASNPTLIDATTSITTTPGAATSLAYTTPPPAATSTGTRFSVVVAEQDLYGNAVTTDSSTNVTLAATGGGFSCLTRSPARLTNGTVTFSNCSYSSSGASYTLTASAGALTPATAATTVVGPPSKLAFTTPPPASTNPGTTFSVVVTEQDASGNTEAGDSSTAVALHASGSGGGFSCSTSPTRVTNGVATYTGCSYTIPSGTPYTLTASSGGLTSATATTTVVSTPSKLAFTTPPPGSTSASSVFTVVVAEQDSFGNTVVTDSTTALSLAANNGGGGFACAVTPANVTNGVATYTGCSYTVASGTAYTLTASSTGLASATANTIVAGVATQLVYTTAPPASSVAGTPFTVVVAEQDTFGNTETTDSATPVNLAANIGGGGFSCSVTPIKVTNGVATFTGCAYTIASGTPYTLTATSGVLAPATANTTVTVGPKFKLVYTTAPPATTTAGTTFSVAVAEQDASGNTETGDSTTTLALAANNGGGGFSCTVTPTHVTLGVATYTGCRYTVASATAYTLTASSAGLVSATSTTTVSAGTATKLVYSAAPPGATTAATTFTVVVTEQDGFSNTETGDSTTTLALAASNGGGGFTCTVTPTHVTNGVATYTGCRYTVASATAYTLTASSAGLASATSNTTVSAGTATKLVYTTSPPATTTAGTTFSVVVAEQDASGNTETGDSATTLNLAANNGGGGFSCTVTPTHVTNGAATYTGCSYTIASGTAYTLTASSAGLASATSTTTVSAGTATKLVYTTPPPAATTVGTTFTVVVTEQDGFSNTETGDSTTVLALAANNGGGGFTCAVTPTHVTIGVATYTGCKYTVASLTSYTLTASSAGLTSATATTHVYGPASKLVYTTTPPVTTTAGTAFSVVVTEEDAVGNTETLDSTTTLNFAANNGGGGFACTNTPTHVTAGVATYTGCSYTVASVTAYTLTASSAGLTSATAPTTVSAGAPTKLVYSTPPPGATTAGTTFTVVVTEQDPYGNPEVGDSTTTLGLAANNGGGGFSCTVTPTHVTNGVATFTGCRYTVASATAFTLTASSGGPLSASATTTVSPAGASKLAYTTPPPATTTAGTTFTVVVAEQDAFSNPETGDSATALTLTAGGGFSCTVTPTHVTNGVATYTGCSYTVASGSAYTLTAASAGLTSATATTTVSAGTATKLVYTTPPPASTTAGSTFTVVVAEQDALGNLESADSATALTLTANNGGGGFSCTVTPTHVTAGTATYTGCSYTVASHSGYTLTAASPGLTSATATTTVGHGAASQVAFTTSPQVIEPSTGSGTITVQTQDPYGNPIPAPAGGYTVALTTSSTHGSFTPGASVTIAAGTSSISFTYQDTASGAPTLTAKIAALANPTATQAETVLSNAADTSVSLSNPAPDPVTAGSSVAYTVTITNSGGGFTSRDYEVTSVSGLPQGAGTGLPSTCVTIRSGRTANVTLTIPTAATTPNGTSTLAVVATAYGSSNGSCTGGVVGTGQGNGTLVVSAPATQLVFVQQPTNVVHNTSITPAITVLLVDDNYNAVATSGVPVTLAVGTNPSGGTLSGGGPTNTTASGVATFATTRISLAGTGYTLTASSAGLASATSTAFNVT